MLQKFTTAIAILLFVSVALACSFLRPKSPLTWSILLELDAAAPDRQSVAKQAGRIIGRRLDAFGVHNATIVTPGPANDQILVILPNVPDRKRLIELITAVGLLELVAVVSPSSPTPVQTYDTEEDALASLGKTVPGNRRVLPYGPGKRWVVVETPAIVNGSDLRDAQAVQSLAGDENYNISFSLMPEGAAKFGEWTGAHVNNYLGVVLNSEVKSIAYIKSQIYDQGEISGRFTKQSAEDLALILRSGALPVPVKVIEIEEKK